MIVYLCNSNDISVCKTGYYINRSTCQSCISHISGSGGEKITDGSTNTCARVTQSPDGVSVQYTLSLNSVCGDKNQIKIQVTMEIQSDCADLINMISVEETSKCGNAYKNSMSVKKCKVTGSAVEQEKRVCGLECKSADSANQCLIHLHSVFNKNIGDVDVCEINMNP